MKITKDHYYCNFGCRDITIHFWDKEKRALLCVNWKEHSKIKWCQICGNRKDTGECKHI